MLAPHVLGELELVRTVPGAHGEGTVQHTTNSVTFDMGSKRSSTGERLGTIVTRKQTGGRSFSLEYL